MWLMTRLAIIFYVSLLWGGSLIVMLFVMHAVDLETIKAYLTLVYDAPKIRMIVFTAACGIILVTFLLENLIYGRRRTERTVAFENASGQVTVSLAAVEDLIKSLVSQLPEIKEIKPFLTANKKGINAQVKLTLRSQVNIPDLTAKLQEIIRRKIEETIGLEGKINIRIHVAKMILEDGKTKRSVDVVDQPQVPFHGYRI
ncbi:MAG: alkaline shock response membrane anchor protein AmaP [Candidatus Omnitrophota bacterium]